MKDGPLFIARSVGRDFANGLRALDDVSLTLMGGSFLSLVGPSGCGKSTLLRLIAGLDAPTRGAIEWPYGRPKPGEIGVVFQDPTLMPWATVLDNVSLPLNLTRRKRDWPDAVVAALDLVGLKDFAGSYPRQLSGGMKMRVALARALVTEPKLLLLDEPFAALDEITRFKLNEDLLRIWQTQRCSVIFVTHSVFEAVFLSSNVSVMSPRPGRIIYDQDVALPYPRHSALRTEPAYGEQCRRVSDALAYAMTLEPAGTAATP
jgi:NitT/TauT family transport system ATP-binding protein